MKRLFFSTAILFQTQLLMPKLQQALALKEV